MNGLLFAILAYLAIQIAIGVWVAPRIRSEDDFLVAGRRLGYPLIIFSVFATWFGSETVLASSARTHADGFAITTAEPFAYGLCLVVTGLVFAAPLWRRRLTTFADFFRARYTPAVERTAALIVIPSSLLWAAAQLRGFGHVLTTVVALDVTTAIAIAAAFCMIYTAFGGLLADAITDLVQGVAIVLGLLALLVAVVVARGGPAAALAAVDPSRISLNTQGMGTLALLEEWAIPLCGSVVAAEMISRAIAARTERIARTGTATAGLLYIVVGLIPVGIGLMAVGLVPPPVVQDQFLPSLARTLLPDALYVVFAGAIISAILSTVDTILLVSAGLVSHNLLAPILRIERDATRLRLARGGVIVFGVVAFLLAARAEGIGELVEAASAFGSAGVLVVVSFGLFTRFGGPRTALLTLLGGLAIFLAGTAAGWPYPYLTSLCGALSLYAGGSLLEGPGLPFTSPNAQPGGGRVQER